MFRVELSKKARKDLDFLPPDCFKKITSQLLTLEKNPFPDKKRVKKIKGVKESLYRLRVDTPGDSYRVFFVIEKPNTVIVLTVVSKKQADRYLRTL
jgi:mRNA-degrading endonuclease RelE of RelBE toxin-antitoxin system